MIIIKTVDLVTINEASKCLKQKDFIYCDGCIYGIDNINGYITYVYVLDALHDKCNDFNGLIFNSRELSAFVKTIGTETEFNIDLNIDNTCNLATFMDGLMVVRKDIYLLSMIKSKRAFSFSVCASKSIQPFFLSASEEFVAIFIVGTGAPRGVPLPVVNKIKWQPAAVKLVTATISFPGPFKRLSPAFSAVSP